MVVIFSLVGPLVEVMGNYFPELKQHESKIRNIIAEEETSFGKTILKVIFRCSLLSHFGISSIFPFPYLEG